MQITACWSSPNSACAFSTAAAKDACVTADASKQHRCITTAKHSREAIHAVSLLPATWIISRIRVGRASAMPAACHCAASMPGGADL
jgi:hypothetical protein